MTNGIIEAVSMALNEEFGDDFKIHMEEIRQGLEEPCFFITRLNTSSERFPGKRYKITTPLHIQYFPKGRETQRECNDVADRMYDCLEYVTAPGDDKPVMGTKMRHEVVDGVLNFFVNYDFFVQKAEQTDAMEEMRAETEVKE
jgi:hypothetical protein